MTGRVCGTGSCVPEQVVSNEDISRMVDTSDAWIRERTGVAGRHVAQTETVVSLASLAARRALENAHMAAEEVDLILVATSTSNTIFPNTACRVQEAIGAVRAAGLDVNAACTGFLAVYQMGLACLACGMAKTVLLIGADVVSRLVDWTDRSTCILFGDGAGAMVLKAGKGELPALALYSDGARGGAITCDSRYRGGTADSLRDPSAYIHMDGHEVFKFALTRVPEVIRETLRAARLSPEDVKYYILHQANIRILEGVAKRLGLPMSRFPSDIAEYGNTSAASIPILLDELNRGGRLAAGDRLMLAGFGAGLTWGAALLVW